MSTVASSLQIQELVTIGGVKVLTCPGSSAFFFQTGMAIDADGAPTAYHPQHGKGLDNLKNAGHPGNWYGVVTNTGRKDGTPVVQGPKDPAPGFYISPTALQSRHLSRTDPRRYVDSSVIPYISLPGRHSSDFHTRLGDLAMVINTHNHRRSAAIYADVGPHGKIGEGSIALAGALGLSTNARHGGVGAHSILYIVFPQSGHGTPLPATAIAMQGEALFAKWGGIQTAALLYSPPAGQH